MRPEIGSTGQTHAEEQDEEEPPEEIGDGERQRDEAVDQPFRQPAAEIGAEERQAGAEDDGDEDGDEHQLQRRRQAREDQGHHVLAAADRSAEIADRDLLQPDHELVEDRQVEAVAGHAAGRHPPGWRRAGSSSRPGCPGRRGAARRRRPRRRTASAGRGADGGELHLDPFPPQPDDGRQQPCGSDRPQQANSQKSRK